MTDVDHAHQVSGEVSQLRLSRPDPPPRSRPAARRLVLAALALVAVVLGGWLIATSHSRSGSTAGGSAAPGSTAAGSHPTIDLAAATPLTTTPPRSDPASPSGVAMPTGDLPGFHQVLAQDFTGTTLPACWGPYQGIPPSSPTALWEPSHVTVQNGIAQLQTYQDPAYHNQWVTAGISSAHCLTQTYGQYDIRFRITKATGVKYAILLWPASGNWPCDGEIDFGEDAGGDRSTTTLTNIYCNPNGTKAQLPQVTIHGDFSQWQTLGIQWTPQHLTWTLNGQTQATITNPHIPSDPMEMDVQTETNTNCTLTDYPCINPTTPTNTNLDIDWITAYAWNGDRAATRHKTASHKRRLPRSPS